MKINPAYRYAIFTSHNFEKQNVSFLITEASQEQRWVKSVLTDDHHVVSFIDATEKTFPRQQQPGSGTSAGRLQLRH